jgi:signal transduction histidine kinase
VRKHYIELFDSQRNVLLYRSGNLKKETLMASLDSFRTTFLFGKEVRVGVFRHADYVLYLGSTMGEIAEMQQHLSRAYLSTAPALLIIAVVGGFWLGRRALRPVADIAKLAGNITASRLSERLPAPAGRDEIAELTTVLNGMFARLQHTFEMEKRFSSDASHQLKTPVTILRSGLEELSHSPRLGSEEYEAIGGLMHQTFRINSMIEDLLLLAQADAGRLELRVSEIDLLQLIATVLDDLSLIATEHQLSVETDLPPTLQASADTKRVQMILQNLVENAVKYNHPGGRVRVVALCERGNAVVRIANTGTTIPAAMHATIFERFHRAHIGEEIGGHGLGLNIARELARAHGGELALLHSQADWTEFELRLPLAQKVPAADAAAGPVPARI